MVDKVRIFPKTVLKNNADWDVKGNPNKILHLYKTITE